MNSEKIAENVQPETSKDENVVRGVLLSLLAVVAGIVAWVALWQFGFIASIVAFLIAWLAVKLYTYGAGGISRRTAPIVLVVILVGIILAFLAGIVSDALQVYIEGSSLSRLGTLFSGDFWAFYFDNIFNNSELWNQYLPDILVSLVFGVLGAFSIVKSLFTDNK